MAVVRSLKLEETRVRDTLFSASKSHPYDPKQLDRRLKMLIQWVSFGWDILPIHHNCLWFWVSKAGDR